MNSACLSLPDHVMNEWQALMRPASWESLDNVSLTRPGANHTEPRILDISVYI